MVAARWPMAMALVGLTACAGEGLGGRVPDRGNPDGRVQGANEAVGPERGRPHWPAGLAAGVDSANRAYSEGRYEEAAARFQRLANDYPDVGAAWFGLYMAETALGNPDAAASALARSEAASAALTLPRQAEPGADG